jgi:BirA family biotin operon repressor/biotin-[acetyl-CoA-carboxylase] ligase
LGLLLESKKGGGYRILGGLDLLASNQILSHLSPSAKALLFDLEVLSTVSSTNTHARLYAEKSNTSGRVIVAEGQTNGRGRRGKTWVSPYGCNLYLSLVWGFDGGVKEIEGLSLAVATAVLGGLKLCGAENIKLKWPNDLLYQKRKIGGILLEVVGDPSGYCQVIIGVGVNMGMPENLSELADQQWANTGEFLDPKVGRNQLAGVVIGELLLLLDGYKKTGFLGYKKEWLEHDAFKGERVELIMVNNSVEGTVHGVDDSGALILKVDGEIKVFSGGEISLRGCA